MTSILQINQEIAKTGQGEVRSQELPINTQTIKANISTNLQIHITSEKSLTQIKKLKKDNKSLENKLQQFIGMEASKSSNVEIQVEEKETNTDPINFTTHTSPNPIEAKTYLDVVVQ